MFIFFEFFDMMLAAGDVAFSTVLFFFLLVGLGLGLGLEFLFLLGLGLVVLVVLFVLGFLIEDRFGWVFWEFLIVEIVFLFFLVVVFNGVLGGFVEDFFCYVVCEIYGIFIFVL